MGGAAARPRPNWRWRSAGFWAAASAGSQTGAASGSACHISDGGGQIVAAFGKAGRIDPQQGVLQRGMAQDAAPGFQNDRMAATGESSQLRGCASPGAASDDDAAKGRFCAHGRLWFGGGREGRQAGRQERAPGTGKGAGTGKKQGGVVAGCGKRAALAAAIRKVMVAPLQQTAMVVTMERFFVLSEPGTSEMARFPGRILSQAQRKPPYWVCDQSGRIGCAG